MPFTPFALNRARDLHASAMQGMAVSGSRLRDLQAAYWRAREKGHERRAINLMERIQALIRRSEGR